MDKAFDAVLHSEVDAAVIAASMAGGGEPSHTQTGVVQGGTVYACHQGA